MSVIQLLLSFLSVGQIETVDRFISERFFLLVTNLQTVNEASDGIRPNTRLKSLIMVLFHEWIMTNKVHLGLLLRIIWNYLGTVWSVIFSKVLLLLLALWE